METASRIVSFALAAALGAAASGRTAETEPVESARVDLQRVTGDARSFRGFNADEKGIVEIKPFANAAGRLTFRLAGDEVRADTNGDGKIDDSDAPAVKPQRTAITVAARCGKSACEYPVEILFVREKMLILGSRARMEGRWRDRIVGIMDTSLDGVFGNRNDTLSISAPAAAGGDGATQFPWSGTVGIDNVLYSLAMEGAEKLRIDPYTGAVSELRISMEPAPKGVELQLTGRTAGFGAMVRSIAGPIRAVSGACRLTGVFDWPDGKTKMYLQGLPSPVVLGAEPLALRIGPPLTVDFEAVRDGPDVTIRRVKIAGVSGETWQPMDRNREGGPAAYVRAGGKEHRLAIMEYG